MDNIEISPYGELLVYKKEYTPEKVLKIIKENSLKGLRIFAALPSTRLDSIDFLKDYLFLEHLDITCTYGLDFSCLKYLTKLKNLSISANDEKNEIDFSTLSDLEHLALGWGLRRITGLESCTKLNDLCLIDFKEEDFKKISFLINLRKLRVKTSSVKSLDGVERLLNLEMVEFANCRNLGSVKALNGLPHLAKLIFDVCPKLRDLSILDTLPALSVLFLLDCKNVESIKFINNFPLLELFRFGGTTKIADGDMIPAKRIKEVSYRHWKHYNIKIDTPEADRVAKYNREVVKELARRRSLKNK